MHHHADITATEIEKHGLALHEPRWLREQRKKAWEQYLSAPPVDWKKNKIPVFDCDEGIRNLDWSSQAFSLSVPKAAEKGKAGKVILEDGKLIHLSLKKELAYEGVFFSDFRTAVLERADLVEKYFSKNSMEDDRLFLFSEALWSNGYFLYIPEKLRIEEPFEIMLLKSDSQSTTILQNLIIADKGAEILVEEHAQSKQQGKNISLFANTTQVRAEKESRILFQRLRNWEGAVYDLSSFQASANSGAAICSVFVFRGAHAGRLTITGALLENGAKIEQYGIVIGRQDERLKISARMHHSASHTTGFSAFKAGLKEHAYVYFDGQITIDPSAIKSASHLQEHVMLLSPHARSDALPALHIEAGDVQVTHSASVSKADPEQLFYCLSRGLEEKESNELILEGFFEEILQKISSPIWLEKARAVVYAS